MLELELVQFRQALCALEIRRLTLLLKLQFLAERIAQPALDEIDGEIGDINADPLATQLLRRVNRRAATAKRVEHNIAGIGAGFDDAFEKGLWLLGRVAEKLFPQALNWPQICPHIAQSYTFHLVEVTLIRRNSAGFALHDSAILQ